MLTEGLGGDVEDNSQVSDWDKGTAVHPGEELKIGKDLQFKLRHAEFEWMKRRKRLCQCGP